MNRREKLHTEQEWACIDACNHACALVRTLNMSPEYVPRDIFYNNMSPYVPFSRHARVLGGTARRACAYSVNDQRAHDASTRSAEVICCSGERSITGTPCILGKRRISCMLFPRKSTGIMQWALHVESHMQDAVIEHVRRVGDHWSYDAL